VCRFCFLEGFPETIDLELHICWLILVKLAGDKDQSDLLSSSKAELVDGINWKEKQ
jgi:hypothetical protein